MYRLVTLLNLTSVMLSISSMIFFSLSEFPELLLIEFRKTGRRYLQVLEIYSCACNDEKSWILICPNHGPLGIIEILIF